MAGAARKRHGGEQVGAEEDATERGQICLESKIKPISDDALYDKASGERIEGK